MGVLRLVGADLGEGVALRPRTRVRFRWKVQVGHRSWIGEGVWFHSQDHIYVGHDAGDEPQAPEVERLTAATGVRFRADDAVSLADTVIRVRSDEFTWDHDRIVDREHPLRQLGRQPLGRLLLPAGPPARHVEVDDVVPVAGGGLVDVRLGEDVVGRRDDRLKVCARVVAQRAERVEAWHLATQAGQAAARPGSVPAGMVSGKARSAGLARGQAPSRRSGVSIKDSTEAPKGNVQGERRNGADASRRTGVGFLRNEMSLRPPSLQARGGLSNHRVRQGRRLDGVTGQAAGELARSGRAGESTRPHLSPADSRAWLDGVAAILWTVSLESPLGTYWRVSPSDAPEYAGGLQRVQKASRAGLILLIRVCRVDVIPAAEVSSAARLGRAQATPISADIVGAFEGVGVTLV